MRWNLSIGVGFALAVVASGCLPTLEGAQCTEGQSCASGLVCNQGVCVTPGAIPDGSLNPPLDASGAGAEGGQGGVGAEGGQGGAGAEGGQGGAGAEGGEGGAGGAGAQGGAGAEGGEGGAGAGGQGGEGGGAGAGGAGAEGGEGGGGPGGAGGEGGEAGAGGGAGAGGTGAEGGEGGGGPGGEGGQGGEGGGGGGPTCFVDGSLRFAGDECDAQGPCRLPGRIVCDPLPFLTGACEPTEMPGDPCTSVSNGCTSDGHFTCLLDVLVCDAPQLGQACPASITMPGGEICRAPGTYQCAITDRLECAITDQLPEAVCDGRDDDCDGRVDEGHSDGDGDGFAACVDCDDGNREVFPGAEERCNGFDDDCDPTTEDDGLGALNGTCVCNPGDPAAGVDAGCQVDCDAGFADRDGLPGCERGCAGGDTFDLLDGLPVARRLRARVAVGPGLVQRAPGRTHLFAAAPLGQEPTFVGNAGVALDGPEDARLVLALSRDELSQIALGQGSLLNDREFPVTYDEVSLRAYQGRWFVAARVTVPFMNAKPRLVLWRIQPGQFEPTVARLISPGTELSNPRHPELVPPPEGVVGEAPWLAVIDQVPGAGAVPEQKRLRIFSVPAVAGGPFVERAAGLDADYDVGPLAAVREGDAAYVVARALGGDRLRIAQLTTIAGGVAPALTVQTIASENDFNWSIHQRPPVLGSAPGSRPQLAVPLVTDGAGALAWLAGSGPASGPFSLDPIGDRVVTADVSRRAVAAWRTGTQAAVAFSHPGADTALEDRNAPIGCRLHLPDAAPPELLATGANFAPIAFAPDCAAVVGSATDVQSDRAWLAYVAENSQTLRVVEALCE